MVELERAGVPTVMIVSKGFERDATDSCKAFGMVPIPYVLVPLCYNNLSAEESVRNTDPVIDHIAGLLTTPTEPRRPGPDRVPPATLETFEGVDQMNAYDRFNAAFVERDWSDNYPLLPPTEERVEGLVRGTTLPRDHVVCFLPPGSGSATVEKIAINAAMAGCKPEHMPVVIAALRAIFKIVEEQSPRAGRVFLTGTIATAPMIMVNGPIVRRIGLNDGRCPLGPGRHNDVNVKIGRAVCLCLKNIGHWYPGGLDADTIGNPRKFSMCLAENERESPWEPYHVSLGFPAKASTVTVFSVNGEWDIGFQGHLDPTHLLRCMGAHMDGGTGGYLMTGPGGQDYSEEGRIVVMTPPHAIPLAEGGFSKKAVSKYLYEYTKMPATRLLETTRTQSDKMLPEWKWLSRLPASETDGILLPIVERPELIHVVVAGGARGDDTLMKTQQLPATVEITDVALQ